MRKLFYLLALLWLLSPISPAQDCIFEIKDDESLETALSSFHDVMAPLWHGPVAEENMYPLRQQIQALIDARNAIMQSNLPPDKSDICPEFSTKAKLFAESVNHLESLVENKGSDDELKQAFSEMHDAYRNMRMALVSAGDILEAFHDAMHPLWHESYPAKDVEAITKGVASLRARAENILEGPIPKGVDAEEYRNSASALLEAINRLQEATETGDSETILNAFAEVHEIFHRLYEE